MRAVAHPDDPEASLSVPSGCETRVLDYPLFQRRVMPLLAQAYAMWFAGQRVRSLSQELESSRAAGALDAALLARLHAASSGLKSLTTKTALDGIEECRRVGGR